jgi:hypothetical protein
MHPHVSGTIVWVSLKQDARGNLVVKTPIFVSGHETRSTAIPKLGKTRISMSGHETRSNRWIFPFPPFAEGICYERPLDVIIIPTDGHTTVRLLRKTVRFFFRVVIMNRQNIRACGTPPNIPTEGQMTEIFFPNVIMHYFCKMATY